MYIILFVILFIPALFSLAVMFTLVYINITLLVVLGIHELIKLIKRS